MKKTKQAIEDNNATSLWSQLMVLLDEPLRVIIHSTCARNNI